MYRATPKRDYSKSSLLGDGRYFSHQISITSLTGVGGSTLFRGLQRHFEKFPFRFLSGGMIMRIKAQELGMSIEEFAQYNLEHPEDGYDHVCDNMIRSFGQHNYVVAEGRLPHIFMPRSFRVLLTCDISVRARRRAADCGRSVEQVREIIAARDFSDNTRYGRLYPGCLWSPEDFDLVVDTERTDQGSVVLEVLSAHAKWQKNLTIVSGVQIPVL